MNENIEKSTNTGEDEAVESAVLRQLLDLHPTRLTLRSWSGSWGA